MKIIKKNQFYKIISNLLKEEQILLEEILEKMEENFQSKF